MFEGWLSRKGASKGIWMRRKVFFDDNTFIISRDEKYENNDIQYPMNKALMITELENDAIELKFSNLESIILCSKNQNLRNELKFKFKTILEHSGITDKYEQFSIICKIGSGFTSNVYLVQNTSTSRLAVLKTANKDNQAAIKSLKNENNFLTKFQHPMIIKKLSIVENSKMFSLCLEYAPGGDLNFWMSRTPNRTNEDIKNIMAEILVVLEFLHSHNIIYRDLKPENILLNLDGHILLTDFGFSIESASASEICGTMSYMSPEMIKHVEYTNMIDIWAYGILLFEISFGYTPFSGRSKEDTASAILNDDLKFPKHATPEIKDLITNILKKDPKERLTLDKIHSSKFFDGIDWNLVRERKYQIKNPPMKDVHLIPTNFSAKYTSQKIDLSSFS